MIAWRLATWSAQALALAWRSSSSFFRFEIWTGRASLLASMSASRILASVSSFSACWSCFRRSSTKADLLLISVTTEARSASELASCYWAAPSSLALLFTALLRDWHSALLSDRSLTFCPTWLSKPFNCYSKSAFLPYWVVMLDRILCFSLVKLSLSVTIWLILFLKSSTVVVSELIAETIWDTFVSADMISFWADLWAATASLYAWV